MKRERERERLRSICVCDRLDVEKNGEEDKDKRMTEAEGSEVEW